jgi:hypothetical protein
LVNPFKNSGLTDLSKIRNRFFTIVSLICGTVISFAATIGMVFPKYYFNTTVQPPVLLGAGLTILKGKTLSKRVAGVLAKSLNEYIKDEPKDK